MSKLNLIVLAVCAMMSFALRAESEDNENANSDLTSENMFGLLRVDSTAKETIVAVPWVKAGTDDQPISVKNLISSKNINEGDELLVYKGNYGKYDGYAFASGQWVAANNVSETGKVVVSPDPDTATQNRGTAVLLRRNTDSSKPFYLFGQVVTSSAAVETPIVKGAINLVAPPSDKEIDFNSASDVEFVGTISDDDRILIFSATTGSQVTYKHSSSGWYSGSSKRTANYNCKVKPGIGVWYQAGADSGVTAIKWLSIPSVDVSK